MITGSKRGSITVEAAIIVPFILTVLMAVIISFMIMYQKVLLTRTASAAAQRAAEIWMEGGDILKGADPSKDEKLSLHDLYSDFFTDSNASFNYSGQLELKPGAKVPESGQDGRIQYIREFVVSKMQAALIEPDITVMNIQFSNNIIQKKLVVELRQKIRVPAGKVVSAFTGSDSLELTAGGTAVIEQPVEYIRNVDLVLEYISRLGPKFDMDDIWDSLRDKVLKK